MCLSKENNIFDIGEIAVTKILVHYYWYYFDYYIIIIFSLTNLVKRIE